MNQKIKILGIAGSLREKSYNKLLLQSAQKMLPSDSTLEIFDLSNIPLYNQDCENPLPSIVSSFKEAIHASDAVLLACAEYNYSISGVLKNALDWGSRPSGQSAWAGKPVGIMGASPSIQGTSRAQYHLRQVLVGLNMYPMNRPELMIGLAQEKFDGTGLIDPETKKKLEQFLLHFVKHAQAGVTAK